METHQFDSSIDLLYVSDGSLATPTKAETEWGCRPTKSENFARPVIGVIHGVDAHGEPLIEFGAKLVVSPVKARTMVPINSTDVSRKAVVLFEDGDLMRPIILGMLHEGGRDIRSVNAEVDGEKLVLNATHEIVLRCGNASITLTRAGKVLIQGEYVLTRSKGVNRVKGASVQIN
jgi:hypothetical protein